MVLSLQDVEGLFIYIFPKSLGTKHRFTAAGLQSFEFIVTQGSLFSTARNSHLLPLSLVSIRMGACFLYLVFGIIFFELIRACKQTDASDLLLCERLCFEMYRQEDCVSLIWRKQNESYERFKDLTQPATEKTITKPDKSYINATSASASASLNPNSNSSSAQTSSLVMPDEYL